MLIPRRFVPACLVVLLLLAGPPAGADTQPSAPDQFRLFLRDGTTVAVLGEFARVGERVVFTLALQAGGEPERLHAASLPASAIDWQKTDEYAIAVRAARYARTHGEADYAALTAAVARAFSRVADTRNAIERLQIVEEVRGVVATWGRDHYGYRAREVRDIQSLLDNLVSELRAEAGITLFDLSLVAPAVEQPPVTQLPAPSLAESIEQALRVAQASDVAADRVALGRAVIDAIGKSGNNLPAGWAERTRAIAAGAIADDLRADRAYGEMKASLLSRARAAAGRADTEGVEAVLADVDRRDSRLGRKRPDQVAALVAAIGSELDAARRLRLAQDRWRLLLPAYRDYMRMLRSPMREMARAGKALESIRRLSGPDPDVVLSTRARLERVVQVAARVTVPADLDGAHSLFMSACHLALNALDLRGRAIASGDLQLAWDASAAAAGAAMLRAQAGQQIEALLRPPERR